MKKAHLIYMLEMPQYVHGCQHNTIIFIDPRTSKADGVKMIQFIPAGSLDNLIDLVTYFSNQIQFFPAGVLDKMD